MQISKINIRSNNDLQIDPIMSEMSASKVYPFDAHNHHFYFQNTAGLSFLQSNGTQRAIPPYCPFTDYLNHFQDNSTVSNQLFRFYDHSFMTNPITTTILSLSRSALAQLIILMLTLCVVPTVIILKLIPNRLLLQVHPKHFINHILLLM